mmetsp:Transcript_6079/g.10991  ORF Transcript_6079/g.10991 Transcript_6079/m.10991 type:complete len:207 (+) Transcript_6079:730-1350(+)
MQSVSVHRGFQNGNLKWMSGARSFCVRWRLCQRLPRLALGCPPLPLPRSCKTLHTSLRLLAAIWSDTARLGHATQASTQTSISSQFTGSRAFPASLYGCVTAAEHQCPSLMAASSFRLVCNWNGLLAGQLRRACTRWFAQRPRRTPSLGPRLQAGASGGCPLQCSVIFPLTRYYSPSAPLGLHRQTQSILRPMLVTKCGKIWSSSA